MKQWKEEEIQFLKTNNKKLTLSEFSKHFGRTEKSVKLKINRLRLSIVLENKQTTKCLNCNKDITDYISVNRKYCNSSCAASNTNRTKTRKDKKPTYACKRCGNLSKNKKFCSHFCASRSKSETAYKNFLENPGVGYRNEYNPVVFKPYLLKEQNNCCSKCGNKDTWCGKPIVFIMDHIDGNATNNHRSNLRLICPNCDSQLDTYKSKNKGKGREYRRKEYQAKVAE